MSPIANSAPNITTNDAVLSLSSPTISIVMAAYNEEHGISRALESILAQTFIDWELIVIDDASTDATADIIRRYAKEDRRIRIVCNESNLKLPTSLNKGIGLARADLIARADADDINLPERLSKQYEFLQLHQEVDVLGTGAYLVDGKGHRVNPFLQAQTHAEHKRLPFLKSHFFHSSVIIRRRFFDAVGLYDPLYVRGQDKELWLRGLSGGRRYANLPEPLIEYSTAGYWRSWRSIIDEELSLLRMAKKYKVKNGYSNVLLSFAHYVAMKMHIYKPRSLRSNGASRV